MDTISPVHVDAFGLLCANLYDHVDETDFLAGKVREWSEDDTEAARSVIPDLVSVIRGLLSNMRCSPAVAAGPVRWSGPVRW